MSACTLARRLSLVAQWGPRRRCAACQRARRPFRAVMGHCQERLHHIRPWRRRLGAFVRDAPCAAHADRGCRACPRRRRVKSRTLRMATFLARNVWPSCASSVNNSRYVWMRPTATRPTATRPTATRPTATDAPRPKNACARTHNWLAHLDIRHIGWYYYE
jgi:hypothetical protein